MAWSYNRRMTANPLRELPSVDALLRRDDNAGLVEVHGRERVVAALRDALQEARAAGEARPADRLAAAASAALSRPPCLWRDAGIEAAVQALLERPGLAVGKA